MFNKRIFLMQIRKLRSSLLATPSCQQTADLLCQLLLLKAWSDKGYVNLADWLDGGGQSKSFASIIYQQLAPVINYGDKYFFTGELDEQLRRFSADVAAFSLASLPVEEIISIYSEIRHAEERQRLGAYYSPPEVVDFILQHTLLPQLQTVPVEEVTLLDPACGCGYFLSRAYDYFRAAYQERGFSAEDIPALILRRNLFGVDLDPWALQLAALLLLEKERALLRRGGKQLPTLNLALADALPKNPGRVGNFSLAAGQFNVVVGNPPHVTNYARRSQRLEQRYIDVLTAQYEFCRGRTSNRYNLVMFFWERFWELVKPGGMAGLVVDGSGLHTTVYGEIRAYIWANSLIQHVVESLEVFAGVNSRQSIIIFKPVLEKNKEIIGNNRICYRHGLDGKPIMLRQGSWQGGQWGKPKAPEVAALLTKITASGQPLEKLYRPVSGMNVTNRPEAGLKPFLAPEPLDSTYHKAIFSGNISPYILRWPIEEQLKPRSRKQKYICYDRQLAVAINRYLAQRGEKARVSIGRSDERFRQPKLFVRQSLGGERVLAAAYSADPEEYCDNSVYVINSGGQNFSLFYLLALLNSSILTFYARESGILSVASSGTATRLPMGGYKGKGLRHLPIPVVSPAKQEPLSTLAWEVTTKGEDLVAAERKGDFQQVAKIKAKIAKLQFQLNELVYDLYNLNRDEIILLEQS
jgi:hypothetical protein